MSEDENDLPPVINPAPASPPPPPASSFGARLLNIFAIPGQVFAEVRQVRHSVANWLVPALLCAAAMAAMTVAMLSMPTIQKEVAIQQNKMRESQAAALAESVKAGKTTPAEAEQAEQAMEAVTKPAIMSLAAAVVGFMVGLGRVFWWAFVLWVLARSFLRRPIPYGKALEVAGLASMISLLTTLVVLVLLVNVGKSFGAEGFTLSVTDFAGAVKPTTALTLMSFLKTGLDFWLVGVLGIGLAQLTGVPRFRGIFLVLGYWLLTEFAFLLAGRGVMG